MGTESTPNFAGHIRRCHSVHLLSVTMLGHNNPLHLLTHLFLALPSLVSSQPPPFLSNNHVAIDIARSPPPYQVTCDQRTTPADKSFKTDCRALIQQHVIASPGPFGNPGSTAWKEQISASMSSVWTVRSRHCSVSFSTRRPVAAETWNTVKEGIMAIAHDCVDQKGLGGKRAQVIEAGGGPRPESLIVWITPATSNNPTYSPPPERVNDRICAQARRFQRTLIPQQKRIQQACCKMAVGFCAVLTGGYLGPTSNSVAAGAIVAGTVAGYQGVREFRAAQRPELSGLPSAPSPATAASHTLPVKRRRSLQSWKRKVLLDGDP